jgi:hypothetical protein
VKYISSSLLMRERLFLRRVMESWEVDCYLASWVMSSGVGVGDLSVRKILRRRRIFLLRYLRQKDRM